MWDLENLNPESRFYFDEQNKEQNWVDLQLASDSQVNQMRKAAGISQKIEYLENKKSHRLERTDYLDTTEKNMEKLNDLVNDFLIKDWCLIDQHQKEIPCTPEMKKKMMGESIKFATFVSDKLEIMRKDQESSDKEEIKN